jgi:hypothetical protein
VLVTSQGVPQITDAQSGKNNLFIDTAAGAPGKHSYYFLFNGF